MKKQQTQQYDRQEMGLQPIQEPTSKSRERDFNSKLKYPLSSSELFNAFSSPQAWAQNNSADPKDVQGKQDLYGHNPFQDSSSKKYKQHSMQFFQSSAQSQAQGLLEERQKNMKQQLQIVQPSKNQYTMDNNSEDDQDVEDDMGFDQEHMMTDQDFDGQQDYQEDSVQDEQLD
jgi:hypothetical protein